MKRTVSEGSKLKTEASVVGVSSSKIRTSHSIKRRRNISYPFSLSQKAITTGLLLVVFLLLCALVVYIPIYHREELPINKNEVTQSENVSRVQFQSLEPEVKQLNQNVKELLDVLKKTEKGQIENVNEIEKENENISREKSSNLVGDNNNPRKFAVFFNTYTNPDETEYSFGIIYDILRRLNENPTLSNAPVYFSRFGDLNKWPVTKCENDGRRQCVEITAREEGDEILTIDYLYNYCRENTNHRVIYMHSKGSFTKSWNNRLLKNILVKAIFSDECLLEMGTNGMDCNTCSSQFSGFPAHYSGNMWVADCDYVSKLIPPIEFGQKKQEISELMIETTHKLRPDNPEDDRWVMELENGPTIHFHNASKWMILRPSWIGTGRYSTEHWLGSHPELKPCDVFSQKNGIPTFSYDNMKRKRVFASTVTAKLETAPGLSFKESWEHPYRLHPWYRKAGKLHEYKILYGKIPDRESSWFFKYWKGTPIHH